MHMNDMCYRFVTVLKEVAIRGNYAQSADWKENSRFLYNQPRCDLLVIERQKGALRR
jgi:hypothetical protein